jgi:hypothetical protein
MFELPSLNQHYVTSTTIDWNKILKHDANNKILAIYYHLTNHDTLNLKSIEWACVN